MGGVHIDWGGENFRFPARMDQRIGHDTIWRGRFPKGPDGVSMHFWDHLLICKDVENCPVRPCTYYTKTVESGIGKIRQKYCLLQKYYLKAIIADGLELIQRSGMDYDKVAILGFHLIPLYSQLFQHKMEILRLDGWSRDPDDPEKAHPVYREFRETLDSIDKVWARLCRKVKGKKIGVPKDKRTQYMEALMGKPQAPTRTKGVDVKQGTGAQF